MVFGWILVVAVVVGIAWPVLRERGLPARFGAVPKPAAVEAVDEAATPLYQREELCTHCGHVNPGGRSTCSECGGAMLVDKLSDLWKGKEKESLIREGVQCGILFALMLIAMALSHNLPLTGKLVVLVVTFAGLAWRFLRGVQES